MIRRPPRSPLFPSTTLSRSNEPAEDVAAVVRHQLPRLHDDAHGASDQAAGTETDAARRKIREIVGGRDDVGGDVDVEGGDRKSTRLNSSHREISYAVFCLKKKLSGNFGFRISEDSQLRLTLRNNTSNAQTPGQTLLEPPNLDDHTDYGFFSAVARWYLATGRHWHHKLTGAESRNREFIANPVQSFFIEGASSFCPQDPNSPNSIPTQEFCDFTFTARNLYNRA